MSKIRVKSENLICRVPVTEVSVLTLVCDMQR